MKKQTTIPAVIAAAALLLTACGGSSDAESNTSTSAGAVSVDDCSDPSGAAAPITDKLTVGWSGPTSGPLADAVGNVIEGMRARFEVANAAGGVGGVKLDVVVKDDAFSPERAKANVGEFIQKDKVDVLGTFGAGQLNAVADDQTTACVPLLFAQAGMPEFRVIEDFPWTTEYLPDPGIEMEVVVESLKKKYPDGAKVALATNQTESGQGIANGFKSAIEGTNFEIAAEEALTDPKTAASTLKASGAEVLVVAGVTTDCLAITQAIGRVGWKPDTVIQPSNCVDGATLYAPAGDAADGQQVMVWLKDPNNALYKDDAAVRDYLAGAAAHGADSPTNSYTVNGWAIGDLLVDNFTRASESSDGLSRATIMSAARTQDYHPPMFIDGIKFTMTADHALGILAFQPFEWNAATQAFEKQGDVIDISGRYEN